MTSVRRFVAVLTATVLAALTAVTPAFAGPAPLIEPEPALPAPTGGSTGASAWFLGGWDQAALVSVVSVAVLTVLVLAVALVSRARHHVTPSAA